MLYVAIFRICRQFTSTGMKEDPTAESLPCALRTFWYQQDMGDIREQLTLIKDVKKWCSSLAMLSSYDNSHTLYSYL